VGRSVVSGTIGIIVGILRVGKASSGGKDFLRVTVGRRCRREPELSTRGRCGKRTNDSRGHRGGKGRK